MAQSQQFDYDLIIIGSGAAGSTAALLAHKQGKSVALLEAGTFGGESPNWGDVPIKAMLHAANLYEEARLGTRFGIRSSMLGYNYPSILQWKDRAIARTGAADNRQYYEKLGIDTFHGVAHFLSPHEVSINRKHLTAQHFIIASGSHFTTPDVYGIDTVTYQTPKSILALGRIPRSLFIVGSTSEAIEYAQLFAILGTKVYVSERAMRLMPDEDSEVGEMVEHHLTSAKGVSCLTQTQVVSLEKRGLGVRVSYTRGTVSKSVQVDEILFTSNRAPSTDIGLENASVEFSPAGIDVNERLQTSASHIYAAGSVLDSSCPTHVAMLQGRVAAHNICHKAASQPDASIIPRVTFTYPGIASVGLSENDCIKRDLPINQAIAPLTMIARSNTSDFSTGFVKIIADKKGILLGATVVAPHAGEIIHELALAVHHGMTATDIASMQHAFLSWSEAVRVAASKLAP
jgi:pyruvate/2-oxoglutarate dehydrogenase complex dihydrolipoamide dehydrogenase (E3) component